MITRAEALLIAANFLSSEPELEGGYRLAAGDPIEYRQGWYFDYRIEPIPPPEDSFCGAPGFMVDKRTGTIDDVVWEEWHSLQLACSPDPGREAGG